MKSFPKIAMLVLVLLIFNCSNDDNSGNSETEFSPEMLDGTWRISFFSDENSNRTSEFNGYEFTFDVEEESAVVAYEGNSQTTVVEVFQDIINNESAWIVYTDFDLDNLGDAELSDLVEDWIVTNVNGNATAIEFEELYSNSLPEILHLAKISD